MISIIELFEVKKDYTKIHGHDRFKSDTIEYHFHNFATHPIEEDPNNTPGYSHCVGNSKNKRYLITHINGKHGINQEYARGHGKGKEPIWFKFTKKINEDLYDLSSGKEVSVDSIPKEYK